MEWSGYFRLSGWESFLKEVSLSWELKDEGQKAMWVLGKRVLTKGQVQWLQGRTGLLQASVVPEWGAGKVEFSLASVSSQCVPQALVIHESLGFLNYKTENITKICGEDPRQKVCPMTASVKRGCPNPKAQHWKDLQHQTNSRSWRKEIFCPLSLFLFLTSNSTFACSLLCLPLSDWFPPLCVFCHQPLLTT